MITDIEEKGREEVIRGRKIDYLGYVFSRENVQLRKSVKHKFAVKVKYTKNKKKLQQIKASYWGWCKWGNCRHLWRVITNNDMGFLAKGISQSAKTRDGKRFFDVPVVKMMDIVNIPITVIDFESDVATKEGPGRYCILFTAADGQKRKALTNSYNIKDVLDQAREAERLGKEIFPVTGVVVRRKSIGEGKSTYYFDETN